MNPAKASTYFPNTASSTKQKLTAELYERHCRQCCCFPSAGFGKLIKKEWLKFITNRKST